MSTDVKVGKINLDIKSLDLMRGIRDRQKYERAALYHAPTIHNLPFDVVVKSQMSDQLDPAIPLDTATVQFHDPNRKPLTFTRPPHWLWGLQSPRRFLADVLSKSVNPNIK